MCATRIAVHRLITDDLRGEFETHTIRIEEIDRMYEFVVSDPTTSMPCDSRRFFIAASASSDD